jgi:phosphate butyryltransferase
LGPTRKVRCDDEGLPEIVVQRHRHFDRLLKAREGTEPLISAVAAPEDADSLGGALLVAQHQIIHPIPAGSARKIAAVAKRLDANSMSSTSRTTMPRPPQPSTWRELARPAQ